MIEPYIDWNYSHGYKIEQICADPLILPEYEKVNQRYLVGLNDRNKVTALNKFLVSYREKLRQKQI